MLLAQSTRTCCKWGRALTNCPRAWRIRDLAVRGGYPGYRPDMPVSPHQAEARAGLAEIVHLVTGLPVEEVQPDRAFVDDLRVDSLAMVEIIEGAARRFDVRIDDEAAKGFVRVRDLADHVAARLAG